MKRTTPYLFAIALSALTGVLAAQEPADQEDGPGRGVARISLMNGDVSVRRGDSGDVVAAALNAPLVVQDRVLVGPASRTELQFDRANRLRVGSGSEVRLSELEFGRFQIQIAIGTTTFSVLRDNNTRAELSTPNVLVRPTRRGDYRITVRENGESEITVRSGEAQVSTSGGSEVLRAGYTMMARGSADDAEFQIVDAYGRDDWDGWNEQRDRELERSRSSQYVGGDVYGAEDLDPYGTWENNDSYGMVWRPTQVSADWAPYRNGRWVWADWYGWTWVSADPWGWAPYHYGRWFNDGPRGWCWYPGGIHERQYWRPALVAFFGFGGARVGVGFGGWGNVGWVPLAPHERYYPWYGNRYYGGFRNGGFSNNTTIVNNVNITNVYRNARVNNGITAVGAGDFGRHGFNGGFSAVNHGQLQGAGLVRGQLPVAPTRESLRMSDRPVSGAASFRSADNRAFYSPHAATSVDRVPFLQQQRGMQQAAQHSFGNGAVAPSASPYGVSRGNSVPSAGYGQHGNYGNPPVGASQPAGGNWRTFGNGGGAPASANYGQRGVYSNPSVSNPRTERPSGGNWRSFGGDPGRSTAPAYGNSAPAPDRSYRQDSGRYTAPYGGGSGRAQAPAPQSYGGVPRQEYRPSNSGGFGGSGYRGSESVRISPPIVQQRSQPAPRSEAPRGGGGGDHSSSHGGGGGNHNAEGHNNRR